MDSDNTPINNHPGRRFVPAVVENGAHRFQETVLWRLGDGLRTLFEVLTYPFRRVAWAIGDFFHLLSGPGRTLAIGAGMVLVIAAAAVLLLPGSIESGTQPARPVVVAPRPLAKPTAPPAPRAKAPQPTLHGATPVFTPPAQGSAKAKTSKASTAPAPAESAQPESFSAAADKISSQPTASSSAAAEASTIPGRPAGAKAIAVARDFSAAFVLYETGGEKSDVRAAFAKTTTPELSKALLKRPPRLPADVRVPKAKVLNIVPGPSREGVYTLSVSLLRVGVTSELRLEMEKPKGQGWLVTNVLG